MRSILFYLSLALLIAVRPIACGQRFEALLLEDRGVTPSGSLVQGRDGNFYGTTSFGGAMGSGTVFKVTPTGAHSVLASFNGINDGDGSSGSGPLGGLVEGSDGNFYGTTSDGGPRGGGSVFKVTPTGVLITLVSFDDDQSPRGKLVEGKDSSFYGTTYQGGASNRGTVFKMTQDGELTTLVSFDGTNGSNPMGALLLGSDGSFYGTTYRGGVNNCGTIFKMTPDGVLTTLISFEGTNGSNPFAGLVEGNDGNFYGTTDSGGEADRGTAFRITPEGVLTRLVSFMETNGSRPAAELVQGSDGNFYGTTSSGGRVFRGTAFMMTPDGALTTLVSFDHEIGSYPQTALIKGRDNCFYSTTSSGGAFGRGTIFKMTAEGTVTSISAFDPSNDMYPVALLTEGSDGNFYGTSSRNGNYGSGTALRTTPSGSIVTRLPFNGSNGSYPDERLLKGSDGNLYGTTKWGGRNDLGTIFKVTPSGELMTLLSFESTTGKNPRGGLVEGLAGNFFGVTEHGGGANRGTIFKATKDGELTTLVSFDGRNGSNPVSTLLKGDDGNFYGTTEGGGETDKGTVFKVTPSGVLTTLVSFNRTNGATPTGDLLRGSDGNFYGTTALGGAYDAGAVYKVSPEGVLTTIFSFQGSSGNAPEGGLVEGPDGNFYGTTNWWGPSGFGTIFKVTPDGDLTTLHAFDGTVAAYPSGPIAFGKDGNLYGTAFNIVWRLSLPPLIHLHPPTGVWSKGADLAGVVSANDADTTVKFEYGLTPAYGSNVAATPAVITGTAPAAVSATISGLLPNTTYFYRIVASSSNGTTISNEASFTTAENSPPVVTNDTFAQDRNVMTLEVLSNDSDVDGDLLTITAVTQGSFGAVTTDGATLTYIPGPRFAGRDVFSYTVSDGFDTMNAQVELWGSFTRVLFSQKSEVPGAGWEGSGIPEGTRFKSFGVPSINSSGKLAFTASYAAPGGVAELSVFGFESQEVRCTLAARRREPAPGTAGALFTSFKDPLLSETGQIAFLASLSGGDTNKLNREGLWIHFFSEESGHKTELVARTGTQPPGAPDGARWKSLMDVAFSSRVGPGADVAEEGGGWTLAFTGFMRTGAGGIKSSNDMGLWIAAPEGTLLALQEGQKLMISGSEKQIRSFAALKSLPNASGQGSGLTTSGAVAVKVSFRDGSQAVLQLSRGSAEAAQEITIDTIALSGDSVSEEEENAAKLGLPVQSPSGAVTAWIGALSGKRKPAAVFERNLSDPELIKLLAREDDSAPGVNGATFRSFRSVAVNDSGGVLLLGKVKGRGVTTSNDDALWWKQATSSDSFDLLAREGAQPPGAPQGAKWSAFSSVAIPEEAFGPLFIAKIKGAKGKTADGWGSNSNNQALWAIDSKGELRLIAHEGQEVMLPGSDASKLLKSFTVLSAVPGSPSQPRSFGGDGQIVYRALFNDGSQAIVKVQVP